MNSMKHLHRYPRLSAHMICESLGYFTPLSVDCAIERYKKDEPYSCEWYSHMTNLRCGDYWNDEVTKEVGKDVIRYAFQARHRHNGYMRNYQTAKTLVQTAVEKDVHPEFASWF